MKRTPMKRSPMKRSVPPGFEGLNVSMVDIELPPVPLPRATRRGSYAGTTSGIARPRAPRAECPHLLLMARNQPRPCLLGVLCDGHVQACCACHGNGAVWNKGGSMKAHDCYSVWGCARCHSWLDSSYSASGEDREAAFIRALRRQIIEWSLIATNPTGKPKDREAAEWALDLLILEGWAILNPGLYAVPNDARFQETP